MIIDPFLLITTINGKTIAKTEVIKQTLNPEWKPFVISLTDLGSIYERVTVSCYDWDADGSNDFIGSFTCELAELLYDDVVYPLVNENKKRYLDLYYFLC